MRQGEESDAAELHGDVSTAAPRTRVGLSKRSRIRRHPERAVPDAAEAILRAGRVAHVAYAIDGQPLVVPMTYLYEDGTVYVHGAQASRTMRILQAGTPVCVEVTLLDGLIASRDAKSHSMNYRSVMVFGQAESIEDADTKRAIFERMTQRYFPGRTAGTDYIPARDGDLRATSLLAVHIAELSAKSRSGPPLGAHDDDETALGSRFVVVLPGIDS